MRSAQEQVSEQAKALTAQAWGADSRTTQVVSQEYSANQTASADEGSSGQPHKDGGQW